ncbi:hypothetical protein [Teredinibacter turnerae]|uniref:hypothetical protein n=1 Tax=Teredinibacter turnerae TaxID=2426 RepID=UPI0030D34893
MENGAVVAHERTSNYLAWSEKKASSYRNSYFIHLTVAVLILILGICVVIRVPYSIAKLDNKNIPIPEVKDISDGLAEIENGIRQLLLKTPSILLKNIDFGGEVLWVERTNRNSLLVSIREVGVAEVTIDELKENNRINISGRDLIVRDSNELSIANHSYVTLENKVEILVLKGAILSRGLSEEFSVSYFQNERFDNFPKAAQFSGDVILVSSQDLYVYTSIDFGKTWKKNSVGYDADSRLTGLLVGENCRVVAYRKASQVSYSEDCGATWHKVNTRLSDQEYFILGRVSPDGKFYLVCSDGEIYAFSFEKKILHRGLSMNLDEDSYQDIYFTSDGLTIILHDLFWPVVGRRDGNIVKFDKRVDSHLGLKKIVFYGNGKAFAVGVQGISLVSNDGGSSWEEAHGIPKVRATVSIANKNGYALVFGDGGTVLVNTPGSELWSQVDFSIDNFYARSAFFVSDSEGFVLSKSNSLYLFSLYSDDFLDTRTLTELQDMLLSSDSTDLKLPLSNLLDTNKSLLDAKQLHTRLQQADNKKYIEKIVLRSLIVTILAYFIGVLINNARYAMKLSVFYDSVASSVRLAQSLSDDPVSVQDLVKIINVCMPSIEYGKQLKLSAQEMLRINQMRFG